MADRPSDAQALQREIAERREDLAVSIERLRGTIRHQIEVGRQVRDRVLMMALVGGAVFSILFVGSRALQRRRVTWFSRL